nr:hypothetical protein [Trebonia kvetii]
MPFWPGPFCAGRGPVPFGSGRPERGASSAQGSLDDGRRGPGAGRVLAGPDGGRVVKLPETSWRPSAQRAPPMTRVTTVAMHIGRKAAATHCRKPTRTPAVPADSSARSWTAPTMIEAMNRVSAGSGKKR